MPPLALYPGQPFGSPDISSYPYSGGYDSSQSYAGNNSQGSGTYSSGQYDQLMQQIMQQIQPVLRAIDAGAGQDLKYKYAALKAQYDDAKAARDNAIQLEQMRSETSRYGIDQQRKTAIEQRQELARQFDQTHALDMQKFGLSLAQAYTQYASTPDMVWALNDFKAGLGNVGLGQQPSPISSAATQPTPKSWADFAALAGFGTMPGVQANQTIDGRILSASSTPAPASGTGLYNPSNPSSGGGSGSDPRSSAVNAIMKAIPPSETVGHDGQDWAALGAIRSLYFAGKPGSVEALGAARQKTALAGLARLGYDPNLVDEEYKRGLPYQGSVRSAA